MKFTLKVLNRIKSELDLDPDAIGGAIGTAEVLEKVAGFAIEADSADDREAVDCTPAEVVEAWARDQGIDLLKKLTEGLPAVSESGSGSPDNSVFLGKSSSP